MQDPESNRSDASQVLNQPCPDGNRGEHASRSGKKHHQLDDTKDTGQYKEEQHCPVDTPRPSQQQIQNSEAPTHAPIPSRIVDDRELPLRAVRQGRGPESYAGAVTRSHPADDRAYNGPHTSDPVSRTSVDRESRYKAHNISSTHHHQEQIQALRQDLSGALRENQAKDELIKVLEHKLSCAKADFRRSQEQESRSQELLDIRRRELQGAQVFLNTTDAYSEADIIAMVQSLNSEIFQAAAFLTDKIEASLSAATPRAGHDGSWAIDKAKKLLGEEAVTFLQHDLAEEKAAVVQAALQACLCRSSQMVLLAWSDSSSLDIATRDIYARIEKQEQPVVSRTWRSLTRAQIKRSAYQTSVFRGYMVKSVKAVLIVAGWFPKSLQDTLINSMIDKKISDIVPLITKLDEAMLESITSTDMAIDLPQPGVAFDMRVMQDADGDGSSSGVVLFVSDMGLKRKDRNNSNGKDETTILLRPKVLLEAAFTSRSEGASQRVYEEKY